MSPTSRQRLAAVQAALRNGPREHSDDCNRARAAAGRGAVPLTPGCPWCEQVRAELPETPDRGSGA